LNTSRASGAASAPRLLQGRETQTAKIEMSTIDTKPGGFMSTLAPAEPGRLDAEGIKASRREFRRVIVSGYLGCSIEFYDFFLYSAAAAL
jgi:hypothetical protein